MLLTRSTCAFISTLIRPISAATTTINRRTFVAKAPTTEMPGITVQNIIKCFENYFNFQGGRRWTTKIGTRTWKIGGSQYDGYTQGGVQQTE